MCTTGFHDFKPRSSNDTGLFEKTLLLAEPLPRNPEAETALQSLIWHSEGLFVRPNYSQEECFFHRHRYSHLILSYLILYYLILSYLIHIPFAVPPMRAPPGDSNRRRVRILYLSLSLSIYIYIYTYVCVYIYIYTHDVYKHTHYLSCSGCSPRPPEAYFYKYMSEKDICDNMM